MDYIGRTHYLKRFIGEYMSQSQNAQNKNIKLNTPYIFPNLDVLSFCPETPIEELAKRKEIFTYDVKHEDADFITHLHRNLNVPCYYVGYVFRRTVDANRVFEDYFRVKSSTIQSLDSTFYVSQEYAFFDYDFGSAGNKENWNDKSFDMISSSINCHPLLSKAIWHPTRHGIRFIFKLVPLKSSTDTNINKRSISANDYKTCYRSLANELFKNSGLPNGNFDVGSPSNPFAFSRHPRCVKENGDILHNAPIFVPDQISPLDLFDFMQDADKTLAKDKGRSFDISFDTPEEESFFYDAAVNYLWNDPLFKQAREKHLSLSYGVWRALGTNICGLTKNKPEFGFDLFKQFSSWDTKAYSQAKESDIRKEWVNICTSVAEYNPCTYDYILSHNGHPFDVDPKLNLFSSPAGQSWKKAKLDFAKKYDKQVKSITTFSDKKNNHSYTNQVANVSIVANSANANNPSKASSSKGFLTPQVFDANGVMLHNGLTPDDVRNLLRFTIKGSGENAKPVLNKDILNLQIILENDIAYKDRFSRNILGYKDEFNRKEIQEELYTEIRTAITRDYGLQFGKEDIIDKIKQLCSYNLYNPIYDYLNSLPTWDGVDRTAALLNSLGISPNNIHYNIYTVYIRKWLISSVCRPMQWMKDNSDPSLNDKTDTLLVLKGKQGKKKSTFFKEMCPTPNLFSDSLQSIEHNEKDAAIHTLNYWMIEFAEFDGLIKKSSIETLKHFLSRREERFRPPYGKTMMNARRPSILVGTTNSDQFLNDPTGSRRFWTIELEDNQQIDIDFIKKNRDLLWAQAVAMFEAGETWWLEDDLQKASDEANAKFKRQDPWLEYVERWLVADDSGKNGFSLNELFEALQIRAGALTNFDLSRMKRLLEDLGYHEVRETRTYANGGVLRPRVWRLKEVGRKDYTEGTMTSYPKAITSTEDMSQRIDDIRLNHVGWGNPFTDEQD
jgi:predicted P-loop ATPase